MHNRSGKRLLETRSQEWPETSKIEQIEPDAVVNYDCDNDTYQKHKLGFRIQSSSLLFIRDTIYMPWSEGLKGLRVVRVTINSVFA
jgi:hypothetical protein